jgi:uncharacterized metal-binding protein YceD (DUF177 family)
MKVKIPELTGEEQSFDWEVSSGWVAETLKGNQDADDLDTGLFSSGAPMQLHVWVYRSEDEVFFRAQLDGSVKSTCVRCLEEISLGLSLEFGGMYCPRRRNDVDEPDDPSHYFYGGDEIDFGEAVREHLFLNLPINPSCEDAGTECQGDVLRDKYNLDKGFEDEPSDAPKIDKRWAALAEIKENLAKQKKES